MVGAKTFEFEGKGTGTSDDIPVKVAGNHVNVSDGEKAVILPAKTAQNPQALDMIEDVIQQNVYVQHRFGKKQNFLRDVTARFGVTNLMDTEPPIADESRGYQGGTVSAKGRTFYLEISKKL